ncbi:MAG: hypothetical protein Q4A86_04460, partial [Clostridia bacterium]|nr:hypothetical protein [Clostridia bacterium]
MYINANDFKNERNDSAMIQAAIDAAKETGKAVVIPKINERTGKAVWDISEGLVLYSGSIVILQNCHLRLADGAVCNMFRNSHSKTDIALEEEGAERDIRIIGMGKALVDGGIHNGLYEDNGIARKVMKKSEHKISENCMMFFQNVENLIIENITVKNHRYWGICLYRVSYSRI